MKKMDLKNSEELAGLSIIELIELAEELLEQIKLELMQVAE